MLRWFLVFVDILVDVSFKLLFCSPLFPAPQFPFFASCVVGFMAGPKRARMAFRSAVAAATAAKRAFSLAQALHYANRAIGLARGLDLEAPPSRGSGLAVDDLASADASVAVYEVPDTVGAKLGDWKGVTGGGGGYW